MPPEATSTPNKISRSLGIALGVTEIMYLLGLAMLATGISLSYGIAWALIVVGAVLLITTVWIQHTLDKGKS